MECSSNVLNFVASASGAGDVGTRLLLPRMECAALMVSLRGQLGASASESVSESMSSSSSDGV